MYKVIYPTKDSTLYSQFPEKNVGVDQILEIAKYTQGTPSLENDATVYYDATYNSRILIYFDLATVSQSITSGKINSNAQYFLSMRATEAIGLPIAYTLYAFPISGSWANGTGFYNNNPALTNGVSWRYRDSKGQGTLWATQSYNANSTGSFGSIDHGGNWFTSSIASQSFNHESPDVRMDITRIVRQWISGSIPNEGMIIKLADLIEFDSSSFGSIKFFSTETHTVYVPRLEVYWDDQDNSGTGSISEISSEDFVLYVKNLKETYADSEVNKIKIGVRSRYPNTTYVTSSNYLTQYRIPTSSYFQIQDRVTDEAIVPFNSIGTKVSCDTSGNYIKIDCSGLQPERYYKLVFKTEFEGGDIVKFIDDGHIFRVTRS